MKEYIVRRFVLFVPTLLLATLIVFVLFFLVPGDTALFILTGEEGAGAVTDEDIAKLRSGIEAALRKRPVGSEALERAIEQIAHRIRVTGERDVESGYIGGLVMDQLRRLDEVAYVRFASVYRSFQDVTEFEEEIRLLKMRSDAGAERRQLPLLPDDADDAGQSNR